MSMSSLERRIYDILRAENISFEQEKNFKDCYNGYYRFDFFCPSYNIIFEANGQQHYQFTKAFHKKRSDFTKAQERDRRKISYCLARDIKLYCIPYWEIEKLNNFSDLIQEKFLAHSQFHNDNIWREHQKLISSK